MKWLVSALAITALLACGGRPRPRDVTGRGGVEDASAPPEASIAPPPAPSPPLAAPAGARLRLVARVSCRALAVDGARLYFADDVEDALFSAPKAGGTPVRLARRAPVSGALAVEGPLLAWVGTPGDVVLGVSTGGGAPVTLRDRGIFVDVAMHGGDVFVAEVVASGGNVTRITGPTAARIATLDSSPRGIAVDGAWVYVAAASRLVRAPRERGAIETLATGASFDNPALDAGAAYAVATTANGARAIWRVSKNGGEPRAIAAGVRAAPIAVDGGELFYFDAQRPQLRALAIGDGASPRVVAEDDALARPGAISVDDTTVFVATGERDDGAIHAIARR